MLTSERTLAVADLGPLYKVTGPNGECLNGGSGDWPIPQDGNPGEWREVSGEVASCRNGLHLATAAQLPTWLPRDGSPYRVWRAEVRGDRVVDAGSKVVADAVRLLPPDPAAAARRDAALARADRAIAAADRKAAAVERKAEREHSRALKAADALPGSPAWDAYIAAAGVLRVPEAARPMIALANARGEARNAADRAYRIAAGEAAGIRREAAALREAAEAEYLASL